MEAVEEKKSSQLGLFSLIPNDVLYHAFSYLDVNSIFSLNKLSKGFRDLVNQLLTKDFFWQGKKSKSANIIFLCKIGNLSVLCDYLGLLKTEADLSEISVNESKSKLGIIKQLITITDNNNFSAVYWLAYHSHENIMNHLFNMAIQLIKSKNSLKIEFKEILLKNSLYKIELRKLCYAIIFHRNNQVSALAIELKSLIKAENLTEVNTELMKAIVISHNLEALKKLANPENSAEIFNFFAQLNDRLKHEYRLLLKSLIAQQAVAMIEYIIDSRNGAKKIDDYHDNKNFSLLYEAIFQCTKETSLGREKIVKLLLMLGGDIFEVRNPHQEEFSRSSKVCAKESEIKQSLVNFFDKVSTTLSEKSKNEIEGWVMATFYLRKAEKAMSKQQNKSFKFYFKQALAASLDFLAVYVVRILQESLPQHTSYDKEALSKWLQLEGGEKIKDADFQKLIKSKLEEFKTSSGKFKFFKGVSEKHGNSSNSTTHKCILQ